MARRAGSGSLIWPTPAQIIRPTQTRSAPVLLSGGWVRNNGDLINIM
jgi:hypothetical protein